MGKKQNKIEKTCPNCNEKYYIYPSEENKRKFCSVKCRKAFHAVHKICEYCNNEYSVMPSQKDSKYCSDKCCKKDKYEKSLETRICSQCGKDFIIQKSSHNPFCSDECLNLWHDEHCKIKYNCDNCGKEFDMLKSRLNSGQKYFYCSYDCANKASVKGIYLQCEICGKEVYRMQSKLYGHTFCSSDCQHKYFENKITKTCEYCDEEYLVKKSKENSRFCSEECRNKWQSENSTGENSSNWKGGLVNCECAQCHKEIKIKPHRLKLNNKKFCSYECRDKYYSIPENRTEKQRVADKTLSTNAIKYIKPSLTAPHKTINSILSNNNIKYRIEEFITYYKMDIYLYAANLGIEIQGDFWHSNPNRFKVLKYKRQLDGIYRDKAKHTYVKNKYGYEILYLWEMDINKNLEMCEKLIQEYINRNGKLENYHSFNYYINENGKLVLKNNLIIPYQDMNTKELAKFKDIKNKVA